MMQGRIIAIVTALAFAAPVPAGAEPSPSVQTELDRCVAASNGGDLALKDCYVSFAIAEDARLNQAWKRLMSEVGGPRTKIGAALVAEQRQWVKFKDASCRHYLLASGTMGRLESQTCYADTISRRADALEQFFQFYEGHPLTVNF